jgi:hypothetical protein
MIWVSGLVILLWTFFVIKAVWNGNQRGERLFYVFCSLWVLGPVPFALMWLDAAQLLSLDSDYGAMLFFGTVSGAIITAFIGEGFDW